MGGRVLGLRTLRDSFRSSKVRWVEMLQKDSVEGQPGQAVSISTQILVKSTEWHAEICNP